MSTTTNQPLAGSQYTRHDRYYFDDGNCVFLIGNVLFKPHRGILSLHSALLKDMFTLPLPDASEGLTDQLPVRFNGMSSEGFSQLLDMIYQPASSTTERSTEAWMDILDAAHQLQVDWIAELSLQRLLERPVIDPVDKIAYVQRFEDKRALARDAYIALVRRETSLSIEEAQRIGLVDTVRIFQCRERVAQQNRTPPSTVTPGRRRLSAFRVPGAAGSPGSGGSSTGPQVHSLASGLAPAMATLIVPAGVTSAYAHGPPGSMNGFPSFGPRIVDQPEDDLLAERAVDAMFRFGPTSPSTSTRLGSGAMEHGHG